MKWIYFLSVAAMVALVASNARRSEEIPAANDIVAIETLGVPTSRPKPPPYPTSHITPEFKPSAPQSEALRRAEERESEWAERKTLFLETNLHLSAAEIAKFEVLHAKTLETERELVALPGDSEEEEEKLMGALENNRRVYQDSLREILGEARWELLSSLYRDHWNMAAEDASLSLASPLL